MVDLSPLTFGNIGILTNLYSNLVFRANNKKCDGRGIKTISLFQPLIEIDPNAPFWVNELTVEIINTMIDTYSSKRNVVTK